MTTPDHPIQNPGGNAAQGSAVEPPAASAVEPPATGPAEPPAESAVEPIVLYRVRFRTEASPASAAAARVLMHFDDPQPTDAVVETLSADSFVELARKPPLEGELLLLFLSDRAPDQDQWRREAEAWMDGDGEDFGPALRAGVEGGWVLWRPGRAVVLSPPHRGEDLLAAVADFAFHHGELSSLEKELAAQWPSLREDLPLVHKVGRKDLRRLPHVEKMTALTLGWRLRAARIEHRLLTPAPALTPPARRLGEKLRALAGVEDRLGVLDGRIEVYEYDYEMINQRFSDYHHFRKEFIAEILIVAMLAIDMVLLAVEFYLNYLAPGNGNGE